MIHIFKKTLLCSMLVVFTASCSSNVDTEATSDVDTEVNSGEGSQVVNIDQAEQSKPIEKQDISDTSKDNLTTSIPLEDYIDINTYGDRSYLTPLFLAQTTRDMSDEDRLGFMSAEYNSEQDQFKKSDLGKSILPEVNKEISKYEGDFGIKIPFGTISESYHPYYSSYSKYNKNYDTIGIEAIDITLLPYDFEKKQFPLFQCINGQAGTFIPLHYSNISRKNDQNIELYFASLAPKEASYSTKELLGNLFQYRYKNLSCGLDVEDQEKAREIEGLRSKYEIDTKGYFYYKVTANENSLIAQPTYAKFTVFNINNGEELATKEFTWSNEDRF